MGSYDETAPPIVNVIPRAINREVFVQKNFRPSNINVRELRLIISRIR